MVFPPRQGVTLAGRTIYIIHDLGDLDLDPAATGFDLVISGHSHQPKTENGPGYRLPQPRQRRAAPFQAADHARHG